MQIIAIDIGELVRENHLLKKISSYMEFDFIYELVSPYYSAIGHKCINPVSLIKMLLVGYLYGIKSGRHLTEEVSLNLAYRWFYGFDLTDKVPDHSLFSQNRKWRFMDSTIFRDILNQIHNSTRAFFSSIDDRDEKVTRLYAVVGRLDKVLPDIKVRISFRIFIYQIACRNCFTWAVVNINIKPFFVQICLSIPKPQIRYIIWRIRSILIVFFLFIIYRWVYQTYFEHYSKHSLYHVLITLGG